MKQFSKLIFFIIGLLGHKYILCGYTDKSVLYNQSVFNYIIEHNIPNTRDIVELRNAIIDLKRKSPSVFKEVERKLSTVKYIDKKLESLSHEDLCKYCVLVTSLYVVRELKAKEDRESKKIANDLVANDLYNDLAQSFSVLENQGTFDHKKVTKKHVDPV